MTQHAPGALLDEVEAADRVVPSSRWNSDLRLELGTLMLMVLLAMPLLLSPWRGQISILEGLLQSHRYREISGFVALGLIAFQMLLALRKRTALRLPLRLDGLRRVHKLFGVPLLIVIVMHTGGRVGQNLNRWLLSSLVGMIFIAQTSHVMKAYLAERAADPAAVVAIRRMNQLTNSGDGWVHQAGLQLHIALAVTTVALLGFHVLSVYFF